MSDTDEVVAEFLVECHEALQQYDEDLLGLEQDPTDRSALGRVFRNVHTIKGTCGFLGFATLESITHTAENLLGRLRDGELVVDAEVAGALLETGDAVRAILGVIERTGAEGDAVYGELVARLAGLCEQASAASSDVGGGRADPGPGATGSDEGAGDVPTSVPAPADAAAAEAAPTDDAPAVAGRAVGPREGGAAAAGDDQPPDQPAGQDQPPGQPAGQGQPASDQPAAEHGAGAVSDTSIRVDVGLLDHLMNLVGELVLARNQIVALAGDDRDSELSGASGRLNLVTSELQEGVMKTRMQPIGNVWSLFPRVVRDLSVQCGKKIRLDMEGRDTELDKTLLEAIKDPLTHLVRNAVDHGIEDPDARVAAGKDPQGRLSLNAFHEGGQVNVEIADDGRGIDADWIKAKAVARGVLAQAEADRLTEREAVHLIFSPGFSTADEVTSVSGRGVGMDVVKSNVEHIGGTIDVTSRPGAGTTFRLKIPLTLAIIPALVVRAADHDFAIPQVNLTELVRLEGEDARQAIEDVHGAPVYRLRGRLLPVVDLAEQIGTGRRAEGDVRNIVVLHTDEQSFGLVVDEVSDTQEIVVKPLAQQVKDIPIFAGATIMGDGRVALILDVPGLAQRARVTTEARELALSDDGRESVGDEGEQHTLLLVALGGDRRAAVPLSEVARLEEFAAAAVEWSGSREVVQYRGEILPLVRLASAPGYAPAGAEDPPSAPGDPPSAPGDPLRVVVHARGGRSVGLVVGQVIDIVEQRVDIDESASGHGVLGSAVVAGHVTDVLDVGHLVAQAEPAHAGVS